MTFPFVKYLIPMGWRYGSSRTRNGPVGHFLPGYSPELNPAERIFEEIRRHIEGIVYPSLFAKQHRIDQFLRRLRADKQRLQQLVAWDWIADIFNQLPKIISCLTFT